VRDPLETEPVQMLEAKETYMMLKRRFSVMPSRLVPMAVTSIIVPQNPWMGRYDARNHDDATGNTKNIKPSTHWGGGGS